MFMNINLSDNNIVLMDRHLSVRLSSQMFVYSMFLTHVPCVKKTAEKSIFYEATIHNNSMNLIKFVILVP